MKLFYYFLSLILISTLYNCGENELPQISQSTDIIEKNEELIEIDSIQLQIDELAKRIITNRNVEKKLSEYGDVNTERVVVIYTKHGRMKFRLYTNTPLHRANFIMLSKLKFYDNTLFYRIIDNFMIQGGNSDDEQMGIKFSSIGRYRIPNEINRNNIHKKGAIAMAVPTEEQDFGKKSSAINFYIVEGRKINVSYFSKKRNDGKKYTESQKKIYTTVGGAPHLDRDYTVFGEMISGFGTLDKISRTKVDKYNWPKQEVKIDSIRAY